MPDFRVWLWLGLMLFVMLVGGDVTAQEIGGGGGDFEGSVVEPIRGWVVAVAIVASLILGVIVAFAIVQSPWNPSIGLVTVAVVGSVALAVPVIYTLLTGLVDSVRACC